VRAIGLDVHRDFCAVAICERGRARVAGRVGTSPEQLERVGGSLALTDRVVLEATGNAWAIERVLEPHVAEVVLAHPKRVRAIAEAKIKTDKVDAPVLAELLAADYIPRVWIGDELTQMLRRLVSRRRGLVKGLRRSRTRSRLCCTATSRAVAGLGPVRPRRPRVTGRTRAPARGALIVDGCPRQLDFLGAEINAVDRAIAQQVVDDEDVRWLRRSPASVDYRDCVARRDRRRLAPPLPRHLVGYLGLHPKIRQSGPGPARHGRTSKEGSAAAHSVLVGVGRSPAEVNRPRTIRGSSCVRSEVTTNL
jgi:transposase